MTDLPQLTAVDASRLLDGWAREWAPSTWDKPALVEACTGRSEAAVIRFINDWIAERPGQAPDPAWLSSRVDSVDRSENIKALRSAARSALNRQPGAQI